MNLLQKWLLIFVFINHFAISVSLASDIARDIREGRGAPQSDDGGYLELGLALAWTKNPIQGLAESEKLLGLSIDINGQYQWKGFFIETISESESGLTLGYNLYAGEHALVDTIVSRLHSEISEDIDDDLDGLRDRDADTMLGLRSTHYYGSNILQVELLGDISNKHKGYIFNASLGKYWQVRNWNLHTILSVRHRSDKLVDYYLGIRGQESTAGFPVYKAGAGNELDLEIGLTYPLKEDWILRATAQYIYLSGELSNSPLAYDNYGIILFNSINYVF